MNYCGQSSSLELFDGGGALLLCIQSSALLELKEILYCIPSSSQCALADFPLTLPLTLHKLRSVF